ncbi:DUF1127 domain-containing protein [Marimonas lutisalis]|uniref:DUF1127 domain-containing protein n=1 Tax=Marimonas lutisalis TaxID=2545756 RepID=UPI0010F675B3|nr:DUF1127 domain-containing protein [Marimonas lutisalis]
MAYTTANNTVPAHGLAALALRAEALVERINRYRLYRRTLAEMADMSAHEFDELGFSHANLRAAAYEAVYGSQN